MQKESDFFHVFGEHQVILFVLGAVVVFGIVFAIGTIVGRLAERRKGRHDRKDM